MRRVAFKRINDLTLEYAMEYYPDCFTPTGMLVSDIEPIEEWCKHHDCGQINLTWPKQIQFRNEEELSYFLLRWG